MVSTALRQIIILRKGGKFKIGIMKRNIRYRMGWLVVPVLMMFGVTVLAQPLTPRAIDTVQVEQPAGPLVPVKYVKVQDAKTKHKFWLTFQTLEDLQQLQEMGYVILKTRERKGKFLGTVGVVGSVLLEVAGEVLKEKIRDDRQRPIPPVPDY